MAPLLLALTIAACGSRERFDWDLPEGFPEPPVPADNPMTAAKVELGRHLFHDRRLSGNGTQSCATCHQPRLAFTDGRIHAIGSTGAAHRRNTMTLANVAYASTLTWAHDRLDRLEDQMLIPMFGEDPVEMGLRSADELLVRLRDDARYEALFAAAFPGEGLTMDGVAKALAAFERTIVSGRSPYDRWLAGDERALSAAAARGAELFFSERLECFHCHGGFNLSDSVGHPNDDAPPPRPFHNTGLYDVDGAGAYPASDTGLVEQTGDPADMGRFKAPTLRNVAVTAPYMHDGSIATLEEVVRHYEDGGRTITDGPNAGVGADSPRKDEFVDGFVLTDEERADLLAFLESLTDEAFLEDPRWADPFARP